MAGRHVCRINVIILSTFHCRCAISAQPEGRNRRDSYHTITKRHRGTGLEHRNAPSPRLLNRGARSNGIKPYNVSGLKQKKKVLQCLESLHLVCPTQPSPLYGAVRQIYEAPRAASASPIRRRVRKEIGRSPRVKKESCTLSSLPAEWPRPPPPARWGRARKNTTLPNP
ncbi:hypothetical protein EVAR_26834_1 [Eumeta japonica]|uniref:Uncharacterized protein n=1 Tax=Eumeta variegata TaxID=151549 RepID=A0A4C1VY27_EUMVA|nr:hypothetical protein EVAR_26834_1 [Eumeta japonica]